MADAVEPAAERNRDRGREQDPDRASGHSVSDQPTAGEYVLGGLGVVVVAALLVFLAIDGLAVREGAARLTASVSGVTQVDGGWQVAFEVSNDGGEAAEEVQVSGTLTGPDGAEESASAVLARVPADSRRGGVLLFTSDPADGRLEVRPEGYAQP